MLLIYLIIIVAVFMAVIVIVFLKRYVRCPADKILVIYGKVGPDKHDGRTTRVIHGGAVFVWPIFQEYEFMDLKMMEITDSQTFLSSDNERCKVQWKIRFGISTDSDIVYNAAERLIGLSQSAIQNICEDIALGQIRLVIARISKSVLETTEGIELIHMNCEKEIQRELNKIGIGLINLNFKDVVFPTKPSF